jgi:hypothetical protein
MYGNEPIYEASHFSVLSSLLLRPNSYLQKFTPQQPFHKVPKLWLFLEPSYTPINTGAESIILCI